MAVAIGLTVWELGALAAAAVGAIFFASPAGQQATRGAAREVGRWVENQRATPAAPPRVNPFPPSCAQGCPGPDPKPSPPEPPPQDVGPILAAAAAAAAAGAAASKHKPVIPGQEYSDQTCANQKLKELHAKKDSICKSIQTVQPPKKPYADPEGADAARKKRLCDNLLQRQQDLENCIKARQDIQDECFDSPKNTQDEIDRDQAHKEQMEQLKRALAKNEENIKLFGCP